MNRKQLATAMRRIGLQSVGRGASGISGVVGTLQTEGRNWNAEAGVRWDNSIVAAAIRYAVNGFSEMMPYIRRRKAQGGYERVSNPEMERLLMDPNDWYDDETMLSGWIISELCGSDGQSYSYVHRSPAGKVIALEYVSHFAVQPYVGPGSRNFVDCYRLAVRTSAGRGFIPVDPQNMLVQRYGAVNPQVPQISIGPLNAVLMEICTDKEAAKYVAALIANVGISPHFFTPRGEGIEITKEQSDQFLSLYEERITGDNRGKPLMGNIAWDVHQLGLAPKDMDMGSIRDVTEERICAVLNIPPLCLNLGTGLVNTNNRASADAAARQGARSFLKPYARKRSKQMTVFFRGDVLAPDEEIYYPSEEIEALQEDKTETAKRDKLEVEVHCTINEKRAEKGKPAIEGGDVTLAMLKSSGKQAPEGADPEDLQDDD